MRQHVTHNLFQMYIKRLCTNLRGVACNLLMSKSNMTKFSCKNASKTDTSFRILGHLYTFLFCQRPVHLEINLF